jgi:hypothetical protein
MPASFARTTRALEDRGGSGPLVGLLLAAVILGWLGWFFLARVRVQEVSVAARLEARSAAHPVTAEIAGKVVENRLTIGRAVEAGEVLVRLDAEGERLAIQENVARRDACRTRLLALFGREARTFIERVDFVVTQNSHAFLRRVACRPLHALTRSAPPRRGASHKVYPPSRLRSASLKSCPGMGWHPRPYHFRSNSSWI